MKRLKRTFPDADLEVVRKAYRMSAEGHLGQQRASGEAYITHPVNVALILAEMGLDPVTCAAALLHDLLEDTKTTRATLEAEFGEAVARVVEGVTKITRLNFREDSEARENRQAQNIRKLLVATTQDLRVILIKLADRLHNMRTLEFLPEDKRVSIARETMDIYAPLAHRLGISEWRWELEDHAFHILDPESYKEVARAVAMKRREREIYLRQTIALLDRKLSEAEIPARVIGRPKHLFSIHEKIKSQNKDFSQVYDVLGVRIITQSEAACYSALGVVHSLWPPLPDRVKDYVAVPKENMYQAIHTTVVRENGRPMEVQIRSEEMDRVAREGVAAHWVYKEGSRDEALDARLIWLRRLHDWLKDEDIGDGLMDSMRQEINPRSYVYVYTPKGDVIELPEGATPLDLAYHVHSHVGHHCLGARVNEKMVSLRYNLQNGDVVE
ncbi:MAG TPA: RelA/SpoT family protein, partial [Candidatus Hydrogenedentes bacterium]|nr:RelA/SpoT family protein [Candidatus Hydrogenedentota bacterium]